MYGSDNTVIHPVENLGVLRIIEAVKAADQIPGDPADAVKGNGIVCIRCVYKLPIDLDGEISLNRYRQRMSDIFRNMARIKGKEIRENNSGIGYRFNNEGNQISYKCDVDRVTTINFNRNTVRKYASQLSETSDSASLKIDKCMINYSVDYTPEFDVNDSFDEIFEKFNSK